MFTLKPLESLVLKAQAFQWNYFMLPAAINHRGIETRRKKGEAFNASVSFGV
jgi:hypothetical protein